MSESKSRLELESEQQPRVCLVGIEKILDCNPFLRRVKIFSCQTLEPLDLERREINRLNCVHQIRKI